MNINLNQKLLSLCDDYHTGKLTKDGYRIQRCTELERLSEQTEEESKKLALHSDTRKKHIIVSVVLFFVFSFIVFLILV